MNFSPAELFLLAWAVVATIAWGRARYRLYNYARMTRIVVAAVMEGRAKFVMDEVGDIKAKGVTE